MDSWIINGFASDIIFSGPPWKPLVFGSLNLFILLFFSQVGFEQLPGLSEGSPLESLAVSAHCFVEAQGVGALGRL